MNNFFSDNYLSVRISFYLFIIADRKISIHQTVSDKDMPALSTIGKSSHGDIFIIV